MAVLETNETGLGAGVAEEGVTPVLILLLILLLLLLGGVVVTLRGSKNPPKQLAYLVTVEHEVKQKAAFVHPLSIVHSRGALAAN